MLDAVGLSAEQQAIYLALLEFSSATPAQFRDRVPGVRGRSAVAALESADLVSRLTGQPVRYRSAPPDMALEVLVRAREQELQQVRLEVARLAERFRAGLDSVRPEEVVEVVTTRDATLQRWEQLQRSARHEVRSFDRPPYASDVLINPWKLRASPPGYRSALCTRGSAWSCRYGSLPCSGWSWRASRPG
jgi:sugar-specific transcriptional regulator TrmB